MTDGETRSWPQPDRGDPNPGELIDGELIDGETYVELVEHARRRMPRSIQRHADPEDIVQRVLLEFQAQPETCAADLVGDDLRAWLFSRVNWRTLNLCRDHAKTVGETALSLVPAGSGPATDGTVTRADTRRLVRDLVERLPRPYAEVVRRHALEGRTFVGIARDLGQSEDAVRKRYSRACEALGRHLAKYDDG